MTHPIFSSQADVSRNDTESAISQAAAIIERFGGIRPMASKLGAPVTTVQGWKKRGIIPGNRRAEIIAAAAQHGIEIADMLGGAGPAPGANENARALDTAASDDDDANLGDMNFADRLCEIDQQARQPASGLQASSPSAEAFPRRPAAPSATASALYPARDADNKSSEAQLKTLLKATEQRAVTKSAITTLVLCLMAAGAAVALLWPAHVTPPAERLAAQEAEAKIQALESKIAALEAQQNTLTQIVPSDLDQKIAALETQTRDVRESMGAALLRAQSAATKALGGDMGSALGQQAAALGAQVETQAAALAQTWNVQATLAQWSSMATSDQGGAMLGDAMRALQEALATLENAQAASGVTDTAPATAATPAVALEQARAQDPALAQVFEGVPAKDLEAAAYLLALTQLRESLSRDDRPFAQDMAILKRLIGESDPELASALDRLAPQAEKGILTPAGLSQELRQQSGDILVASLAGENVSLTERAQASIANVLQIEKNGEAVTGTPTQKAVSQAQNLIDQGNIAGALSVMEGLQGPGAQQARLWISRAQSSLLAQQVKALVQDAIRARSLPVPAAPGVSAPAQTIKPLVPQQ